MPYVHGIHAGLADLKVKLPQAIGVVAGRISSIVYQIKDSGSVECISLKYDVFLNDDL